FGPAEWAPATQFAERNLLSTRVLGNFAHINGWTSADSSIGNCRASIRTLGRQCFSPGSARGSQRRDRAAEVDAFVWVALKPTADAVVDVRLICLVGQIST